KRNRGMYVCHEMTRSCGTVAEVRYRVDRVIEERSGKMRELNHSVTLENPRGEPSLCNECLCYGEMGDCPRGELMYWREIWLERMNAPAQVGPCTTETKEAEEEVCRVSR
ncbi:MAG TPA: hypothetical protein VLA83_17695, partial [Candidatus Binatia bacterium]|nr:hypothetical protein [Candidatus Binatia bacterium]